MKLVIQKEATTVPREKSPWRAWRFWLRVLLLSWELYPLIIVASFLRLYWINSAGFDIDQANVYQMAYDAVHHGMLVATANYSSLGTLNPPAVVYLYMLPAAFSADPLWGTVVMALIGIASVLLTYFFIRRYYGRLAGTIAALLYATMTTFVAYSRIIWNQNLLIVFAPLFIVMLYRGVVERRKGWFVPAVFLLGLMIQFHSSSGLLVVVLLVAIVLAPGTIRGRDLLWAGLALLFLYSPYLLWELHSKFSDLLILWHALKQPSHIDDQALLYYQSNLAGYIPVKGSLVYALASLIEWTNNLLVLVLILAVLMVFAQVLWPILRESQKLREARTFASFWRQVRAWWNDLRADTYRCGLLILLIWQVVPLAILSRHSFPVYSSYLIFFMPGPFILIALLLTRVVQWLRQFKRWGQVGRYALYGLIILVIVLQGASSLGYSVDLARGTLSDGHYGLDFHDKLSDLQNAFAEADQLVQQRHLKHIYVSMYADHYHMASISYLAEHNQIPTTVFNDTCLVLPNPADGPAVFLEGPYDGITDTLLTHFAPVTLINEPFRPGGAPFKLYIVNAQTTTPAGPATFPQQLQLLDTRQITYQSAPWAVTRWSILRSAPMSYQTSYAYTLSNLADGKKHTHDQPCLLTSMQAGDQLLSAFPLNNGGQTLTSLDIRVETSTISALIWTPASSLDPLRITFETGGINTSQIDILQTADGSNQIIIPVPGSR
jgi:hypothetical protein